MRFSIYADRFRIPAAGLAGGKPGATGSCTVFRGNEVFPLKSKDNFPLKAGDLLVLRTGGGGGWGDPAARDASGAARDVRHALTDAVAAE